MPSMPLVFAFREALPACHTRIHWQIIRQLRLEAHAACTSCCRASRGPARSAICVTVHVSAVRFYVFVCFAGQLPSYRRPMASDRVVQTMASAIIVQTTASARIAAHWAAKGTDIIGDNYTYIVRPDLHAYLKLSDYKGRTVIGNRLHDSCLDGSHYFAYLDAPGIGRDYTYFHVIKESSFVRVTNLSTGAKRKEGTLHETCWGGDFYLATSEYHRFTSSPVFIIIFAKSGTFRAVSDLNSGKPSKHLQYDGREEYNLHPNCQNGLYYWSTKSYWGGNVWYYIVKGVDQSGMVEFHYTKDLRTDEHGATESFEATVVELLSLTSTAPSLNPWTGGNMT